MESNEPLFKEDEIHNKQYYEGIKDLIKCSICLDIVKNPVQCNKCQNCFCLLCVKKLTKCPLRCESSKFIPSLICKSLLSNLTIKCRCKKEIGYDFIEKHKREECIYSDFKTNYFLLKESYNTLKQEYNSYKEFKNKYLKLKEENKALTKSNNSATARINVIKRELNEYREYKVKYCNLSKRFEKLIKIEKKFEHLKNEIEGRKKCKEGIYKLKHQSDPISKELKQKYDTIKSDFFVISSLHNHPIEIINRFMNEWECDHCKGRFSENIPSYHCTLCDFDLCFNCTKNSVLQGKTVNKNLCFNYTKNSVLQGQTIKRNLRERKKKDKISVITL